MTMPPVRLATTRCALACLLVFGLVPNARAAFSVTINGTTVTDNGPGDTNSSAGFINYSSTIDGYQIRVTSSTDNSHPTADLTTSQLRIVNTGANGTITGPLVVTISESFNVPPNFRGQQSLTNTLTRNIVAGVGTSGTVSSTTSAASASGGGQGTSAPVTLTNAVDSGSSVGSFSRTSDSYLLSQTINIDNLLGGNAVTITASSFSTSSGANLFTVPGPSSLVLLASGLCTLGGFGFRRRRALSEAAKTETTDS